MKLSTVYTTSLYGLTALASFMLARAEMEESSNVTWWIPMATWPILLLAYVLTEGPRGWKFSAWVANTLGALSVAVAAWEFFGPDHQSKLLSGAHLLVYSTWIVMFQEKNLRSYWWVMALGVLQVAVASVLTSHEWYGLFLVVYLCGALWTMSTASLYQIQLQYGGEGVISSSEAFSPGRTSAVAMPQQRFVQYDEQHRWLTRRFVAGWGFLVLASMVVSAAFFTLTPRVWVGPKNLFASESTPGLEGRSTTGFTKNVRLGEIGSILESVKPVMNLEIYDAQSDRSVPMEKFISRWGMSEILLRGAVLTNYSRGNWSIERPDRPYRITKSYLKPGFRVHVQLEAHDRETLFSMGLPQAGAFGPRNAGLHLHPMTGLLSRESAPESAQRSSYSFFLEPPSAELAQAHAVALPSIITRTSWSDGHIYDCQVFPSRGLSRLRELAEKLVQEGEAKAGKPLLPYERAKLLESYLRDSGNFGYTLDLSVTDRTMDPVEDFLFNRKEGHCEYFASALALMLRAVGIPARLVSGFKGAEPLSSGTIYQVQDRHAHAWVEAWTGNNVWVTLDATPALSRQQSVDEVAARVGFWERLQTKTSNLWTDYVVRVNLERQNQELYGPMREFGLKVWSVMQGVLAFFPAMWNRFVAWVQSPSEWFTLTGAGFGMALLAGLFLISRLLLAIYHWFRKRGWRAWSAQRWQQRTVIAFYEQFLRLAERAGLRRAPTQTPAEFASTVSEHWAPRLDPAGLSSIPEAVCAAYYRVRFGGETLPEADLQALQHAVSQLDQLLFPKRTATQTQP
ncbi:MAG TPA: transglutaminase domain-containing protein [Planctomycetaceae bacterium]|nr:transglutaminase domain-containing protein [Planctomycetaceae bacterium]